MSNDGKVKYRYRQYNVPPKKHETVSIKKTMQNIMKSYQMEARYNNAMVTKLWANITGASIASRTQRVFIKKKVLYVELNSAPLRQELNMKRDRLVQLVNQHMEANAVEEVKFI
ncbi:DUF721 domain-containing protein [Sediminitomix flava]|uniref:Uncharacterized protein DUF721 n=1 Tax=Sediminitomix flava TaxID=379075 RepID=A0A315Z0D4_SEDFL|nr:DUF721 domain-containing protein [Sediminitomix flava]PWJ36127.1 uncharacterized protein DUF721 [Sediminitomix flava]